jgi:hypothetical protein
MFDTGMEVFGVMRSPTTRRASARWILAWLAAAALWPAAPCAWAASASGASGARASIDVRVVIPVVLRVKALSQAREFAVRASDVARGYVDVDDGTSLLITSNNASGFALSVSFDPALASRVEARILGQAVEGASPGSSAHVDAPRMRETLVRVGYRLYLPPGTRAGVYPWPVALAFGAGA